MSHGNAQVEFAVRLLTKHGYTCGRQNRIPQDDKLPLWLEHWVGPKGVVILQWEEGEPGCTTFANWPTGSTWQEFEALLDAKNPNDKTG